MSRKSEPSAGAPSTNRSHRGDSISPTAPSNTPVAPSLESHSRSTHSSRAPFTPKSQTPTTPLFRVPESPQPAASDPHTAKAAKIAIPRLKRSPDDTGEAQNKTAGRHRVNHACEPCRHRKTKCSGERPMCRHCQDFKIGCFYADGKRDRVKKQFGSMTEKVADYEKLLKGLIDRVNDRDAKRIREMLDRDDFDAVDGSVHASEDASRAEADDRSEESGADSDASAAVGSTGALDRTEEDFTRSDAITTGFMGKTSEITWLQRLRQENKYGSPDNAEEEREFKGRTAGKSPLGGKLNSNGPFNPLPEGESGFAVHDSSYHLDDMAISTFENVDPYELPTVETANLLFDAYITRVHPSFPIVGKQILTGQYNRFVIGQLQRPPDKWRAILNMIFAIGAKYSHLIQADWRLDERDHLIYFTRARLLAMNGETLFDHPDLQQIQVAGLMSFYLLAASQVNRAWTVGGFAIRSAIALGMNLRNDSMKLDNTYKEIRYRVWWSLYTLEHRLCGLTGRTNSVLDDHCTTPLPAPFDEESFDTTDAAKMLAPETQQGDRNPVASRSTSATISTPSTDRARSLSKPEVSRSPSFPKTDLVWAKHVTANSSLYFLHLVQLTRLTQDIYMRLYNPTAVVGSWSDIQTTIAELQQSLEEWYQHLPVAFDFKRKQRDRAFYEHRLALGFFYYATCITVNRPCLCRLDRKMPNQSAKSQDFNRQAAALCIDAAQDMLQLIPDEPNAVGLNRVGPWWGILHWLVRATTVLMLEISFRAYHMPQDADSIFESAKKAVRWMHSMGEENASARRAWKLCNTMLREAAAKIGRNCDDLPDRVPGRSLSPEPPDSAGSLSGRLAHFHPVNMSAQFSSSQPPAPNFVGYSHYDHFMRHDQYFPTPGTDNAGYEQGNQPSNADMEFMNDAYHNEQNADQRYS